MPDKIKLEDEKEIILIFPSKNDNNTVETLNKQQNATTNLGKNFRNSKNSTSSDEKQNYFRVSTLGPITYDLKTSSEMNPTPFEESEKTTTTKTLTTEISTPSTISDSIDITTVTPTFTTKKIKIKKSRTRSASSFSKNLNNATTEKLNQNINTNIDSQINAEERKKRLNEIFSKQQRGNLRFRTTSSSTTAKTADLDSSENNESEFEKQINDNTSVEEPSEPSKLTTSTTTNNPIRKEIYSVSSRKNILKKPSNSVPTTTSSTNLEIEEEDFEEDMEEEMEEEKVSSDYYFEPEIITLSPEVISIPDKPLDLDAFMALDENVARNIEHDHQVMIEDVQRVLTIYHKPQFERKIPKIDRFHGDFKNSYFKVPTNPTVLPTRPYRGSAKFVPQYLNRNQIVNEYVALQSRNFPKFKNTPTSVSTGVPQTVPVTSQEQFINNNFAVSDSRFLQSGLNLKASGPVDFRPSLLFGLTLDESNENFDSKMVEKIHQTFIPSSGIQNGFFPVIQNGTPSPIRN